MCLTLLDFYIVDNETFRNKFVNGKITVYKILDTRKGKISSLICNHTWKEGLNKSTRKANYLTAKEKQVCYVSKGFHVYTKRPYGYSSGKIFKLEGNIKDFVSTGSYGTEAVFTKLKLLPKKGK